MTPVGATPTNFTIVSTNGISYTFSIDPTSQGPTDPSNNNIYDVFIVGPASVTSDRITGFIDPTTATDGMGNFLPTIPIDILVTIGAPLAAPTTAPVSQTVAYDSTATPITLSLGGGTAASVAVATAATHGTATASGTTITYTPVTGFFGTDTFTYTATNATGTSSPATATITVSPPVISVTPTTLAGGTVGTAYSHNLSPSGGQAPYTFSTSVASGALPAGLSLGSNGTISGTPTASGAFTFTVSGTDSSTLTHASFTSATISLTIAVAAPTVTSISPTSGPTAGGTSVTITGTNLTGATAVTIGGTAATSVVVVNPTTITATTPAGSAGTASVRVTTAGGTNAANALYTYVAAPTVAAVSQTVGYDSSATPITLSLGGGTAASVAVATAATHGTATASGTTITYTPATGFFGTDTFTYTATNATGTSSPATATITVSPPVISVTPTTLAGGTVGTAYNHNLSPSGGQAPYSFATTLASGALPAGLSLGASGTISGTPTASGVFTFTVSGTDSSTLTHAGFTSATISLTIAVAAPTVSSISPTSGPTAGGTSVTITGTNLTGATAVTIGGTAATSVVVVNATTITATTPAGTAGTASVRVTTAGGTNAANALYTYVAAPTVAAVSQTVGYDSSATPITLSLGGGAAASVAVATAAGHGTATASGTTITYTPATGFFGTDTFTYTATNATGTSSPATATITVSPPVISVTPTTLAGGTVGTAYSQSLSPSGGQAPYSFATTLASGALPAGLSLGASGTISGTPTASGVFTFTVSGTDSSTLTHAGFTSATISLTIAVAAPTVSSISPTSGPTAGGTSVTITGTNLTGATAVTIGGTAATSVVVVNATTITATTPAGTAGTASVRVTTAGGTNAANNLFTYAAPAPTVTGINPTSGPTTGGTSVTITGNNFTGATSVKFGMTNATSFTVISANQISTIAPPGSLGTVDITVRTQGGTSSVSAADRYSYAVPVDSINLRKLQATVTPTAAQVWGQATVGAMESAVSEGFAGGGGRLVSPSGNGLRFNFSADPDDQQQQATDRTTRARGRSGSADPFSSANGSFDTNARGLAGPGRSRANDGNAARTDDAFSALGYAGPVKARPLRAAEPRDWLGWAEISGATLNSWTAPTAVNAVPTIASIYGDQINFTAGLTRVLTPNFLVGVLGGWETFDYRSDAIQGRLTGTGWTAGAYAGWKLSSTISLNTGVAYSGIGFDGTAGTASGSFAGNRLLITGGVTGNYKSYGFLIEPSATVYALWEHENAYTDTLGTAQAGRDFSAGRASTGVKLAYPFAWTSTVILSPYAGIYGDYYFNTDNIVIPGAGALPVTPVFAGTSARTSVGMAAQFASGGQLTVGGERSGLGGSFSLWIYRARASIPFGAQ